MPRAPCLDRPEQRIGAAAAAVIGCVHATQARFADRLVRKAYSAAQPMIAPSPEQREAVDLVLNPRANGAQRAVLFERADRLDQVGRRHRRSLPGARPRTGRRTPSCRRHRVNSSSSGAPSVRGTRCTHARRGRRRWRCRGLRPDRRRASPYRPRAGARSCGTLQVRQQPAVVIDDAAFLGQHHQLRAPSVAPPSPRPRARDVGPRRSAVQPSGDSS